MTAAAHAIPPAPRVGPWSPEEDAVLVASYRDLGAARTAELLGRCLKSTYRRARKIKAAPARWSQRDDGRLRMLWGEVSLPKISRACGRSEPACLSRARKLGLRVGVQPGTEYLEQAAIRAGMTRPALAMALKWHGAKLLPTTWTSRTGATTVRRVVDSEDVDAAVAAWTDSETLTEAARRNGVSPGAMVRILAESGTVKAKPGSRKYWRIPSATIDAAVAARGASEHLFEAAKRVAVHRDTLRAMLRRAGVVGRGKRWRLAPGVVDRVVAAARGGRE